MAKKWNSVPNNEINNNIRYTSSNSIPNPNRTNIRILNNGNTEITRFSTNNNGNIVGTISVQTITNLPITRTNNTN